MFPILPTFTPKTIVDFQSEPDEGALLAKNEADLEHALAQIREYHANDLIPGRLLSHEEPPSDEESEEEEEEGEGTTDEDESIDEDDESAEEGDDDNVAGDVDDLDGDEDDGNGMDEGLDT